MILQMAVPTFSFKILVAQGSNLDLHTRDICKLRVTFIQARKILRVAFSRRQNVKTKLE